MKHNSPKKFSNVTIALSLFLFFTTLGTPKSPTTPIETFAGFPETSESAALNFTRNDISYGSKTPIKLNRSGTYRLAGPLTAATAVTALTLSANNITLDLDGNVISGGATGINVTGNQAMVKNGVIQNTGAAGTVGIKITGAQGQFENLDVISTQTGFLLQSTTANQLTNCRALNSTNAGFSLVSSSTNNFANCQALSTNGGNNSAYGFISQLGYDNNFQSCVAQDTRTSSALGTSVAAGFLLSGERSSSILDSRAQNTLALTSTSASGIYLPSTLSAVKLVTTVASVSANQLSWTPSGLYLAAAAGQILVYPFNTSTGALASPITATPQGGSNAVAVNWSPNGQYLAVGDLSGYVGIYQFASGALNLINPGNVLLGGGAVAVAWSPNGQYLAVGALTPSGNSIFIYTFNPTTGLLTLLTSANPPGLTTIHVAWSPNGQYLAVGSNPPSSVKIYTFNATTGTLSGPIQPNPANTNTTFFLSWAPNGAYLAAPTSAGLYIYSFNGSALNQVATDLAGTMFACAWSPAYTFPDGFYLATTNTSFIYQFNIVSNILTRRIGPGALASSSNPVVWSPTGAYIASSATPLNINTGLIGQGCTIQRNTAMNTTSANKLGVGINASSAAHYIAQNLGTNNNDNFYGVSSNYLASQANARGVYNIDTSLSAVDSVVTINTNINTLLAEDWSVESKAEHVSSSLSIMTACADTPIQTGGTTNSNKTTITSDVVLSTSGCYCLSANLGNSTTGASVTISGNNITLDLNGYTINCNNTETNGVTISGNEVTVQNGTIQNAAQNGISLTGSRCMLANIDVVSSPTGFYISNTNDSSLTNCRALSCSQNGFFLSGCQRNEITSCRVIDVGGSSASSSSVTGFLASGGLSNIFSGCSVDNAFTNVNAASAQAQGFRLVAENYSEITNCTINGVQTTGTLPNLYGIRVPLTQVQNLSYIDSIVPTTKGNSVSWLENTGNRYIAAGCSQGTNREIQVLRYTGSQLTQAAATDWPVSVNSVDWLTSTTSTALYLAIGSANNTTGSGYEVQVYQFAQPSSLTQLSASAGYDHGSYIDQVDWLTSCTSGASRYYLAAGGARDSTGNAIVRVHEFNGISLAPRAIYTTNNNAQVNSVNWLSFTPTPIAYLVIGKNTGGTGAEIRVLQFTGSGLSDTSATYATGKNVNSVKWLVTNTGNYYIASGETGTAQYPIQVRILQFDPVALTLTPLTNYQYGTATSQVNAVSWLPGIDELNYLAIAGNVDGQEVQVLRFDGSCLTPIYTLNDPSSTTALAIDWLKTASTIIAIGADGTNTITVRTLGFSPTRNQITNNTITNVRGGTSATAYAVEANNLLDKNTAYNNGTNYYYTPEVGDSNAGY